MRCRWKNQYHLLESASQFHNKVRTIFTTHSLFKNLACYQEVAVSELCIDYPHRSHHFDWFIKELGAVIELHGAQHYKPVNFGGIGYDDLLVQFRRGQFRDGLKAQAAREAGLVYLEVPYFLSNSLTGDLLLQLIGEASQ